MKEVISFVACELDISILEPRNYAYLVEAIQYAGAINDDCNPLEFEIWRLKV